MLSLGNVLYTDNVQPDGSDGSFDYKAFDGTTLSEFAKVTVDTQDTDSILGNTVTGTDANEILIGRSHGLSDDADEDILNAGGGNDFLSGGTDRDYLNGGTGIDTVSYADSSTGVYVLLRGAVAGFDVISPPPPAVLPGNGFSAPYSLMLTGGDTISGTTLDSALLPFWTGTQLPDFGIVAGDYFPNDGVFTNNSGIDDLESIENVIGTEFRDQVFGSLFDNTIYGLGGNDILLGVGGDDILIGGNGDDVLAGDKYFDAVDPTGVAGNDTLYGGEGADRLFGDGGDDFLDGGTGQDTVNGDNGNDTIVMLVTAGNVDVADGGADNDTLVLRGVVPGDHVVVVDLTSAIDQVVSIGGVTDTLIQKNFENVDMTGLGSSANVTGSAGDNIIIGSHGNDILAGGAGNDTYLFNQGGGQDLVADSAGSADTLAFGAGINPFDLMLSRQANDLRIAVYGTADQVTVQNWFGGSSNQVETIQAGGQTLLSSQVNQLIETMAGFSSDNGMTWDQGLAAKPDEVGAVVAASWQ